MARTNKTLAMMKATPMRPMRAILKATLKITTTLSRRDWHD